MPRVDQSVPSSGSRERPKTAGGRGRRGVSGQEHVAVGLPQKRSGSQQEQEQVPLAAVEAPSRQVNEVEPPQKKPKAKASTAEAVFQGEQTPRMMASPSKGRTFMPCELASAKLAEPPTTTDISTGAEALAPEPQSASLPQRACFTSTGMELSDRQQRIIKQLGLTVVRDWSSEVTHLVADTFRLTMKMMCAICSGVHIVTPEYIIECRKQNCLVDETQYTLKDDVCEAAFARKRGLAPNYSVAMAFERARNNGPLLHGLSVYCFPSVEDKHELPLVVAAAGGTWLTEFPAEPNRDSILLLGSRRTNDAKEEQMRRTFRIFDVELLREAAMTQEIRLSPYRFR